MFLKERNDYTQKLFTKFMRRSGIQPYGYMCSGTTILTIDPKLYKKLKDQDNQKHIKDGCYTYTLEDVGIELSENSQLFSNVQNGILFSAIEEIDGTSDKSVGGEYTLLLINSEKSFDRFAELIPTIIKHHVEENGIDTEKYNIRVPLLHVDVSRHNSSVHLHLGGDYCYSQDFKYAPTFLTAEMDRLKTTNSSSEEEHTL